MVNGVRAFLIAGLLAATVSPAQSQAACASRAKALKLMLEKYNEAPSAVGVTAGGSLLEILTNPDSSSWTLLITRTTHTGITVTCMMATGEDWETLEQSPVGDPT